MNEVLDLLRAFGQSILKLLIGALVGVGAGLLTVGIRAQLAAEVWREPPLGDIFLGVGVGLLASAAAVALLFYGPWSGRKQAARERSQDASPHETR